MTTLARSAQPRRAPPLSMRGKSPCFDISSIGCDASTKCRIKPDRTARRARRSVSRVLSRPKAGMAIHLGRSLPNASRDRPERRRGRPARRRRRCRCRLPLLLGLAPGGVCPAAAVAGGAVRSYRTISPLPPSDSLFASRRARRCVSVALSLGSPPPGVTRHRASVEPGLSSPSANAESGHPTVWHGMMWDRRLLIQRREGPGGIRRTSAMKRCAAAELSPRR